MENKKAGTTLWSDCPMVSLRKDRLLRPLTKEFVYQKALY